MRVLIVTAMFPTGADPVRGIAVAREAARLENAGVHLTIVSKRPGWIGYLHQAADVKRAIGQVDLVHAHFGTSGAVAAICARRRPLVVTLHGSDINHGWRPSRSKYWLQYLASLLAAKRAYRVIVQSEDMLRKLPPSLRNRALVLSQAIDLPPAQDLPAGPESAPYIVLLGDSRRAVKRPALARSAVDKLQRRLPLVSLDEVPPSRVSGLIANARVGLLTSEREGMPIALKEAIARGLPVVAVELPSTVQLATTFPRHVRVCGHAPGAIMAALEDCLMQPLPTTFENATALATMRELRWLGAEHTEALLDLYGHARQ